MYFLNKNILVCGIGISGVAAACALKKCGANVILNDVKKIENFGKYIDIISKNNIKVHDGKNPDDIVLKQDLIVLSPGISMNLDFIKKALENNIEVVGEIEIGFLLCKAPIVAITGTNGKTTTTTLVGQISKSSIQNVNILGNIGKAFCDEVMQIEENDSLVVLETSSFQLESISKFKPKIATILNITQDHLDRHITMEKYIMAKENIFKNQDYNDYLVLNYDDELCKLMQFKAKSKVIFFSMEHILEEGIFLKDNWICIKLFGIDQIFLDIKKIKIKGLHNVQNIMASIAICLCLKINLGNIKTIIQNFDGVEHRIEFVKKLSGISFYNDSKATNPDSTIKAINAFEQPIILIAGGYDKNSDFSDLIDVVKTKVKKLILIGDTKDNIAQICKKKEYFQYQEAISMEDAVKISLKYAENNDSIVLSPACASYDMYQNYEHRGKHFKEIINNL